jgi:hypothetical protein
MVKKLSRTQVSTGALVHRFFREQLSRSHIRGWQLVLFFSGSMTYPQFKTNLGLVLVRCTQRSRFCFDTGLERLIYYAACQSGGMLFMGQPGKAWKG